MKGLLEGSLGGSPRFASWLGTPSHRRSRCPVRVFTPFNLLFISSPRTTSSRSTPQPQQTFSLPPTVFIDIFVTLFSPPTHHLWSCFHFSLRMAPFWSKHCSSLIHTQSPRQRPPTHHLFHFFSYHSSHPPSFVCILTLLCTTFFWAFPCPHVPSSAPHSYLQR